MFEITPEFCLLSLNPKSTCQRCVNSCPEKAWSLENGDLHFDHDLCNSCGLCIPQCPESALGFTDKIKIFKNRSYFKCDGDTNQASPQNTDKNINRCFYSYTEQEIVDLYVKGCRQVVITEPPCASCSIYKKLSTQSERNKFPTSELAIDIIHRLNVELETNRQDKIKVVKLSEAEFNKKKSEEEEVNLSRRFFLRTATEQLDQLKIKSYAPYEKVKSLFSLSQTSWPAVPELNVEKCSGCLDCAKLCPHEALKLDLNLELNEENTNSIKIDAGLCTGCLLCVDVCEPFAIQIQKNKKQTQFQLSLVEKTCRHCENVFYHSEGENRDECLVCQKTKHPRGLLRITN